MAKFAKKLGPVAKSVTFARVTLLQKEVGKPYDCVVETDTVAVLSQSEKRLRLAKGKHSWVPSFVDVPLRNMWKDEITQFRYATFHDDEKAAIKKAKELVEYNIRDQIIIAHAKLTALEVPF
jgi:hypothetical protein